MVPLERAGRGVAALLVVTGLALATWTCAPDEGDAAPPSSVGDPPASEHPDGPPGARWDMVDMLREARDATYAEADGAGRAWIEAEDGADPTATAGTPGRWSIVYEAGPEGIAAGGFVRLIVPSFWFWSDPQDRLPGARGYTTVTASAEDVELRVWTPDRSVIQADVQGRGLAAGERLTFLYGAGSAGALADRYAERESPFWLAVDGDGDGYGRLIEDPPTLEVLPGPAAQLELALPSTAHPGDEVLLRASVLDRVGNTNVAFVGRIELRAVPDWVELPESVPLAAEDLGRASVPVRVPGEGVVRIVGLAIPEDSEDGGEAEDSRRDLPGESNPLEVDDAAPRVLWGDFHGHSNLSDGTGTPEDYFTYAREVAGLDVAVLTDHDHWGMRKMDAHPEMWERIGRAVRVHHEPGAFVTLLGYEWTSWIHGHRHVLYFDDAGEVLSSIDEELESPTQLWDALRAQGVPALTFAHHSAGEPIPTNWDIAPDPEFEPVTEIVSVHGQSESYETPASVRGGMRGNYVRDVLDERGYRLGFVGSGDSHDGHPGLARLANPSAGLAAILAEDATRESVLEALRERRCYATNGSRILLRTALDGQRMGSTLPAATTGDPSVLYVHVLATAPIRSVDVIRSGVTLAVLTPEDAGGAWDFRGAYELEPLEAGEYVYVRVIQEDRGMAWSSPFFVE